ncbi:MAG: T9SS type A sorting domain-containing protein [Ignavibacteriae bacterium]|nr:T9SS type A sorting domain-containing protein [Ignavibacteriota bacterium]
MQYISFSSLKFFNNNTGFVIGTGDGIFTNVCYFFKTTNGGSDWNSIQLPSFMSSYELYNHSFLNINTGYVCGFTNKIFKTTNGGLNWDYSLAPYSTTGNQSYGAIHFLNEQTGYIGGRFGFRAKTTNGGNNWITLDTAYSQIVSVYFLDSNYGFMGDNWSNVYKTTDGGISWNYQYLKDSLSNEYAYTYMKFSNYNTGFLMGRNAYDGILFKTTNSGNNWKKIIYRQNEPFNSIFILDSSNIYIGCNQGLILKSSNRGLNWISQLLPVQNSCNSIYFVSLNTGYAASWERIYKTTNGGVFISSVSSDIPNEFMLFQNYPNPFNPVTNIKYNLPKDVFVKIKIYDILGREIKTLVNEFKNAGSHIVFFNGFEFASGIYFYRIDAGGFTRVKRMVLIK